MSIVAAVKEVVYILLMIFYYYLEAFVRIFVPSPRKSIEGEVVLITGAGHGIGREFALEISKLGATVVLWDINKENNQETAEKVKTNGGKAYTYVCDVTSSSNIASAAAAVRREAGEVTILVNNAGIANVGPFLELSEPDIRRTFEVNSLSHFWMLQEFLPSMIRSKHGHVLNVISMAGFSGQHMLTDYCASKHAARGFFESLLQELTLDGHTDIKMTSLCPMFVDTGLLKNFTTGSGGGRVLTPNEVALAGIDGMLRNREVVTVPAAMAWSVRIGQLMPRKAIQFLMNRTGPKISSQYKKQS